MNNITNHLAVQQQVKSRFKGKKRLKSKVAVRYKQNTEREYVRIVNSCMEALRKSLDEEMEKVIATARINNDGFHADETEDIMDAIEKAFWKISEKNDKLMDGLQDKLDYLAGLSRKLSISEWKRVCKKTLGIDILSDYYMGSFYRLVMDDWVNSNVDLIKSVKDKSLSSMKSIVKQGFLDGRTTTAIMKDIHRSYDMDKRHARFIARDQMAKLNSELTRMQQEDAGVSQYTWSDSGDGRVRARHKELDGKVFRWDDPPIVDKKTGRRCHPGQDYRCRCCAIPFFDIDTINLPIENGGDNSDS